MADLMTESPTTETDNQQGVGENPEQEVSMTTEAPKEGEEVHEHEMYAGKFNSVGDLEKAYNELQSTFSKKLGAFTGAPEDGYQLDEDVVSALDETDQPILEAVQEWGKEHNLSQDGLVELANKYAEVRAQEAEQNIKAAYEQLGENADRRIANVRDHLKSRLGEGDLFDAIATSIQSAPAVEALEKLFATTSAQTPANRPAENVSAERVQEMRFKTNERGDRLMEIDPAYAAKVRAMEAQLYNS